MRILILILVLLLSSPVWALNVGVGLYGTDTPKDGVILNTPSLAGALDANDNPIIDVGYIMFNTTDGIPCEEAKTFWNDTDGTNNLGLKGGNVCLQIGQEMVVRGKNTTGGEIANGTAVRITGGTGSFPEWGLSNAAAPAAAGSIGLSTEIIDNTNFGYITTFGLVRELDTTGTPYGESWNIVDRLWVGNEDGGLTNVRPTGSERKIFMGVPLRINANEGIIMVNPINVSYFNELSGPLLTSGSVVFINSTGMTVEDNANFFWDDVNNRLGIGNATPTKTLDVAGESLFRDTIGPASAMKFHDHDNPLTITLDAGGAFVNITGLTNGPATAGMAQNSSDGSVTVTYGGFYLGTSGFSLQDPDGNSEEYNGDWSVNGAEQECDWHRDITVLSIEGFVGPPCLLDLSPGDVVTFMVNSVGGDDAAFEALNWNLTR